MWAPITILALLTAAPAARASSPDDTGTICTTADGPGPRSSCSRIRFKAPIPEHTATLGTDCTSFAWNDVTPPPTRAVRRRTYA